MEIKSARKTVATQNFKKTEVIKPRKDPKAARSAFLVLLSLMSSPIKAPRKAPTIMPPGIGAINPTINPMVVPMTPAFVPPKRLVPSAGIM